MSLIKSILTNTLNIVRSVLFHTFLMLCTGFFGILLIPAFAMKNEKRLRFARLLGKRWANTILKALKILCGINFTFNHEIINKNAPCIIACKHQSMFETVLFLAHINNVVYVVKQELMSIPVYGWYLKEMGLIPIDRKSPLRSAKLMKEKVSEAISKNLSIVIFPEGSRIPYGKKSKCKSGIFTIYSQNICPIIPVSVNAGKLWPKAITRKAPGTISIAVHEKLPDNMQKEEMLELLNEKINSIKE